MRYNCIQIVTNRFGFCPNVLRNGAYDSVIRPFQPGDIYLLQRLGRQATYLPCVHAFLQPKSSMSVALSAVLPWATTKASTYVLRQDGHGLVHEGFLQVRHNPTTRDAEILCLAPSLDAPLGHPAIWNKLLSNLIHDAGGLGFERIYADVPDQPLLVNTFSAVGFEPFCRQVIWRSFEPAAALNPQRAKQIASPRLAADDWDLAQLYLRTVPEQVRSAEGLTGERATTAIIENLRPEQGVIYVIRADGELTGAFQLQRGQRGTWLRIWGDTLQPDGHDLRILLTQAALVVVESRSPTPLYFASSDFQGGLGIILDELGFAPFCDRVRMVKQVVKWVRESVPSPAAVVETTSEIMPTTFAAPKSPVSSIHSSTPVDSGSAV